MRLAGRVSVWPDAGRRFWPCLYPIGRLISCEGGEYWRFGAVNSTLPIFLQLVLGGVRLRQLRGTRMQVRSRVRKSNGEPFACTYLIVGRSRIGRYDGYFIYLRLYDVLCILQLFSWFKGHKIFSSKPYYSGVTLLLFAISMVNESRRIISPAPNNFISSYKEP